MSLWKIAWRSIQQRSLASILTMVSMALGVALVVAVLVVGGAVRQSFKDNATLGYNMIVGPKGGRLELVLNSVYYLGRPVEVIPYAVYKDFLPASKRSDGKAGKYSMGVLKAVPIAMGDYYEGFRVVGTTPEMFDPLPNGKKYEFSDGQRFESDNVWGAVVGSVVAYQTGVGVGDGVQPSHSVPHGHVHEEQFIVTGVLAPTGTPFDRAVFINIEGFYMLEGHHDPALAKKLESEEEAHDHDHDDADDEAAHDHTDAEEDPGDFRDEAAEDLGDFPDEAGQDQGDFPDESETPPVGSTVLEDQPPLEDVSLEIPAGLPTTILTDDGEAGHEHSHEDEAEASDHDHDHAADEAHDHEDELADEHGHSHDHGHSHEDGEHGHVHEPLPEELRAVSAILIRCDDLTFMSLLRTINKGLVAQAVAPIGEIERMLEYFVRPFQLLLLGLTVLMVIVSAMAIMVGMYNSMSERRHEIAVMRALGAGRGTVLTIVLLESILLSLCGGVLGWLLGHGLTAAISPYIAGQTGVSLGFFEFTALELILLPALVVLATFVGILPAASAYRTDVGKSLTSAP